MKAVALGKITPPSGTITGATNATPIVVTATAHPFATGDTVTVSGVGGNTAANGTWIITNIDANSFRLDGSTGNGTYTSGGVGIGVKLIVTDRTIRAAKILFQVIAGNTGKTHIGVGAAMNITSKAGLIKDMPANASGDPAEFTLDDGCGANLLQPADYAVSGAVTAEGMLATYWQQ